MVNLALDISKVFDFVSRDEIFSLQKEMTEHHKALLNRTGKGGDFLGWMTLPRDIDENLIQSIESDARRVAEMADIFVVIGIGGSYLGSRAVIEALSGYFEHFRSGREHPLVLFAGHQIDEDYHHDLLEILDKRDYALTVISKSGTTTEPAIAFRLLKSHLEKKYGDKGAGERIIAISDKSRGALKNLADIEGYKTYVVPDDVGGRYSVLTPVGLLPIAVSGFDIRELLHGAEHMMKLNEKSSIFDKNPAALYAATRNALFRKGKTTEIFVNYSPALSYFTEWWKQLYGESEGKENKGIFPAGASFTTDLHSMGQYIQEGLRLLFETVLLVDKPRSELIIPYETEDMDGLNYIAGRRMHEVNQMASLGTILAHTDGGVPNISITIPVIDELRLGELIYFFEISCALSGYMLGVNPFDQPGVEAYKKNMFALLGKPGFEQNTTELKKRLKG
ncbi:MAG: glucose-6-phosphate isomerase [Bacteroidetes bacterium]|nr:glucose-6-phosphate isomerase [Bacteroidota bacterium]